MRPFAFRPPLFLSAPVRLFSGSVFVISSKEETDMKRRPGDVGLYLRMATLKDLSVHPSEAMGQTSQPENAQHFSAHACAPSKISIDSPALIWTIAFFQPGFRPLTRPRRFGFERTWITLTRSTWTLNSSSTACRICVLWASGWTRNE